MSEGWPSCPCLNCWAPGPLDSWTPRFLGPSHWAAPHHHRRRELGKIMNNHLSTVQPRPRATREGGKTPNRILCNTEPAQNSLAPGTPGLLESWLQVRGFLVSWTPGLNDAAHTWPWNQRRYRPYQWGMTPRPSPCARWRSAQRPCSSSHLLYMGPGSPRARPPPTVS